MPLYGYLNFRIHPELEKTLEELAKKENRSIGAMIRECIAREAKRQAEEVDIRDRLSKLEEVVGGNVH